MAETRSATPPLWVFLLFSVIGAGLLIGGSFWAFKTRDFLAAAVTAPGRIVDVNSYTDDEGTRMYQPVIAFAAPDGTDYQFTSSISTSWSPQVGKDVTVLYDPADPAGARESGFWNVWLGPVILLGIGVVFLLFGVGLWLLFRGKSLPATESNVDFILDD